MTRRTFPNRYRYRGIVSTSPGVCISVSNNDAFLDRTTSAQPGHFYGRTQPETVRWWIPLVASTGALLVLVLGTAAVVSGIVNQTIGSIG